MGACISKTDSKSKANVERRLHNDPLSVAGKHEMELIYQMEHLLGQGSFGKVFRAKNRADPSIVVAIKVLSKSKLSQDEIQQIYSEVKVLQTLDHPNIVKYYETYEDQKFMFLVMEYCSKGELFDNIAAEGEFTEKDAAVVIEKILKAMLHYQSHNMVHRDIKPDNIMYNADGEIKLIDFGLARQFGTSNMRTLAGTPYFIAPEVLKKKYSKECDIWSVGIVLFLMMTGSYPFDVSNGNRNDLFNLISAGKFEFPKSSKLSIECKDLIRKMLLVNAQKRITPQEALKHPWFNLMRENREELNIKLDANVVNQLKKFKGDSKFKKATLNILVKMLNNKEIQTLQAEFQKIDTDNSGVIEIGELEKAIKNANLNMTAEEIRQIVSEINYEGTDKINYSEFIAASMQVQEFLTDAKLEAIFAQFDMDGDNNINAQNLKDAMQKIGRDITYEEAEEIIKKYDVSGDKKIQFSEFKAMMFDQKQ